MGEIAESMLNGTCCSVCGEYLGLEDDDFEPCGYPVTCGGCSDHDDLDPEFFED